MTFTRRFALLLPLLLLVLFSGCVDTEDSAGTFKATYSLWVGLVAMIGGIGAMIGGWFWKQNDFRGWIFFILALVATIGFLPFGFVDHVTVTEERLTSRWGFWLAPTLHEVEWDDVRLVRLTKEVTRGRRGRRDVNYNLLFSLKSGGTEELTATNPLMEAAAERIVDRLHDRGIEVVNLTGER